MLQRVEAAQQWDMGRSAHVCVPRPCGRHVSEPVVLISTATVSGRQCNPSLRAGADQRRACRLYPQLLLWLRAARARGTPRLSSAPPCETCKYDDQHRSQGRSREQP